MNTTLQYLFSKISAKFGVFFGFKHNFHQTLIYVAYAYHTWMESCACQLNFDTKMSGLAYVPKEQGILLTVRKNPGLQPDTASYVVNIFSLLLLFSFLQHVFNFSIGAYIALKRLLVLRRVLLTFGLRR